MKKTILYLCLFTIALVQGQNENFEDRVQEISRKIERITLKEKSFLKDKIKEIQQREENNEITNAEAKTLKLAAATMHAEKIETQVEKLQIELEELVQKQVAKNITDSNRSETNLPESIKVDKEEGEIIFRKKFKYKSEKANSKRTTSQFIFAYGINNTIEDHQIISLNHSDYNFWKSHFYELGWTYKTRLSKNASKVYLKYGASFVWNYLRAVDNTYQVKNGDLTHLQTHASDLSKSKLRNTYLNFPAHIEFDFSENKRNEDGTKKDRTHQSLRIGLGGYAGIKLGTRQYLKYQNEAGHAVTEKQKGDFNTNNFTYGLSSYIAYKSLGLYVKYDLAPLFNETEIRNISIGLRCDFN
ncbi:hypothetical protein [Flavicella sediminum]|uniref:hypothetical protein n=1 Tax=Flavicella sediminum TaxID=2585141 RepID=UPI0011242141|nr:hypothetical protein [Flavicella sediminum]